MALDFTSVATFAVPLAAGLVATVGAVALSVVRPRWLTFLYMGILLSFGVSSFGEVTTEASATIWSRGSGQLYFSFVMWFLLGIWIALAIGARFRGVQHRSTAMHKWFYAIALLWGLHLLTAVLLGEPLAHAADTTGISTLIFGAIFFAVLLRAFDDEASLDQMVKLFLVVVFIKGIYGVIRFAAFGGDPANVYANFNRIAIRLTYFDSNESFLATIAAFIAAWVLLVRSKELQLGARLFYWAVLLVELTIVVFSYRRAAWGGLVLAAILFMCLLPRVQRVKAMVFGIPVLLSGVVWAASRRLADSLGSQGWFKSFFDDVGAGSNFVALGSRELELRLGKNAFLNSPILGNGTWARYYDGFVQIEWQTGPDAFLWTHSSVLHLAFKTGVVGIGLVALMFISFLVWVLRNQKNIPTLWRGVYFSGLAGVLFQLPAFMYAPSIIEYRTMLLIFFSMALPFMVHRAVAVESTPVSSVKPVRVNLRSAPIGR